MSPRTPLEAACLVLRTLRDAGHEAYLAGGSVRDQLLGLDPADFDVATAAHPEEVEALFRRTLAVGKAFGVIQVLLGRDQIEVATFRTEEGYSDGRRPDVVRFSDARNDVARRDFTINGLLWDPLRDEILDYVGGREDLECRRVRAIGDPEERFAEDALRLLRAVRFGCFRDFRLEEETARAVSRHAPTLRRVAPERIRDELTKIAEGPWSRRGDAVRLLSSTGLSLEILPRALRPEEAEDAARVVDALAHRRLETFLAAMLRDFLPDGTCPRGWRDLGESVGESLRCSTAERRTLARLLEFRARYRDLPLRSRTRARLAATQEDAPLHEDLLQAEGDAPHVLDLLRNVRERHGDRLPPPLLDGREVMALGVPRGPRVGLVLRRLRVEQLEGRIPDADAARHFVRERQA